MEDYVIGLDFGTDSVRAVLANGNTGETISSSAHWYARWKEGKYCDPSNNQYRQHPLDHLEGIEHTIKDVLMESKVDPSHVRGIGIDTTGSSPIAVDAAGIPICFKLEFTDNPNALVVLWKDHTAVSEADEINTISRTWGGVDFTMYEGGIYSSEWFWAKILHITREDKAVHEAAFSWMEHCDLLTYLLVGAPGLKAFKRSRCAAGHKAMWHDNWGGLPDDEFLKILHPDFPELKENLYAATFTSDESAGNLSQEWAKKLGLTSSTVVAVGTFDAHAGALGAEVGENTMVRVMGTSTCDIIVSSYDVIGDKTIRGICGQVDGSVIPGMVGLEAGQSAFGDLLSWFTEVISWPIDHVWNDLPIDKIQSTKDKIIERLSAEAARLPNSAMAPMALDWINGRRTPDADQSLKAAIFNLSLGSKAPEIFKALVEAICYGSKLIVERFENEGVAINTIIGIGGIAKKSPFIMQTLANVLNMPIKIANSEQAPALGAAMYAATAAGIHTSVANAVKAMGSGIEKTYHPITEDVDFYQKQYLQYKQVGEFIEQTNNS